MEHSCLITLCIILLSTKVLGIAAGKLHLPQIVGALIAGLLLGPAGFGLLEPSELLSNLSELGVVVIMFCAGLETNIDDLKKSGKISFLVALLGVLVPLGVGTVMTIFFNPGGPMIENIFIGVVLTATSVSITVEALKEMGKLSTKVGNTILAAALIDDVLGLICLTVVSSLGGNASDILFVLLKIVLFFAFAIVVAILFNKLFELYVKRSSTNLHRYPIAALVLCLFMAWSAEYLFGVADIIGAFAAGLIIASTSKSIYVAHKITPLTYLLLTPIFFANIGLTVVLPEMTTSLIIFSILLIVIGVLTKLVGCGIASKFCGFNMKQSIQIGIGMACRGEVALIVANKGISLGIMPEKFFGPIIIFVIVTSIITPILLKISFKGDDVYEGLHESSLVDNYNVNEQLDIVALQMADQDAKLRNKKSDK